MPWLRIIDCEDLEQIPTKLKRANIQVQIDVRKEDLNLFETSKTQTYWNFQDIITNTDESSIGLLIFIDFCFPPNNNNFVISNGFEYFLLLLFWILKSSEPQKNEIKNQWFEFYWNK